jgi:hypothetical protein
MGQHAHASENRAQFFTAARLLCGFLHFQRTIQIRGIQFASLEQKLTDSHTGDCGRRVNGGVVGVCGQFCAIGDVAFLRSSARDKNARFSLENLAVELALEYSSAIVAPVCTKSSVAAMAVFDLG